MVDSGLSVEVMRASSDMSLRCAARPQAGIRAPYHLSTSVSTQLHKVEQAD